MDGIIDTAKEISKSPYWLFPLTSLRYRKSSNSSGHIVDPNGLPLAYVNTKTELDPPKSFNELLLRQLLRKGRYLYVDPNGLRHKVPVAIYNDKLQALLYESHNRLRIQKIKKLSIPTTGLLYDMNKNSF